MKTIPNVGKINISDTIKDGQGMRIATDFMRKLTTAFAKQSSKYINAISDAPFAYHEKQLHSILAPAISTITDAFLMEQPIERLLTKKRDQTEKNYAGWLDYWCRYREIDLFIELKHDFDDLKTKTIEKRATTNWKDMKTQLESLKKEAKDFSEYCKGVLLISLHVVTIYDIQENEIDIDYEKLIEIQNRYCNKFDSNWSGLWILHRDLYNESHNEDLKQYYPGVMLIARISKLITK